MKANAHSIASSSRVIFLFTSRGANSPFAFYETVFAVWLGRPLIVAVFENCFDKMKLSLSAILSDVPAIDFASTLYLDGLDLLVNEIMPPRAVSGVIFEQKYLRRVAEGVCQFREIAGRYDSKYIRYIFYKSIRVILFHLTGSSKIRTKCFLGAPSNTALLYKLINRN